MKQIVSILSVLVFVVAIEQAPPQGLSAQEEVAALRGGGNSANDRDPAFRGGGAKPESPEVAAKPTEEFKAVVEELQPTLAIASYVHRVRARGRVLAEVNGVRQWIVPETFPNCTAVSIGGGRFVTAGHLTSNLGGTIEVDVEVDGKWVLNASQTQVAGKDALVLKIDQDVPGVTIRKPHHFESVTLYGLTTAKPLDGIFSGDSHLALKPSTPGITFGDSGGAVLGEDGQLVGIIQGFGKDGPRSVYMVSLEDIPEPVSSEPPKAAAPAPPVAKAPVQSCPNGQCQRVQVPQRKGRWGR